MSEWQRPISDEASDKKFMMTSSNGNIFRVTGLLCGEFTGPGEFPAQRPVTRSFEVFFDLRPNKPLSKQLWGWWSETPSSSLWRHRNDEAERQWPDPMTPSDVISVLQLKSSVQYLDLLLHILSIINIFKS